MPTTPPTPRSENIAGTAGIVFQFYIALEKCFLLTAGQVEYIERFGDIAVGNSEQIEVKYYSDDLTDSHPNFWNTLLNWLNDSFDDSRYEHLILLTTQNFGERTVFKNWNNGTPDQRRDILLEILKKSEQRFANSKSVAPPASLVLQRQCIAYKDKTKFGRVLSKLCIDHGAPDATDVHTRIKEQHAKTITLGKMDFYINSLLGYIIQERPANHSFEVSYEDFKKQCEELGAICCKESRRFPRIIQASDNAEIEKQSKDSLFAAKIRDINYLDVLDQAARNYIQAMQVINQEFQANSGVEEDYKAFSRDVHYQLVSLYRRSLRSIESNANIIAKSQDYYDNAILTPPPAFPGREAPSSEFKNGVVQILMDDKEMNLKWRLE